MTAALVGVSATAAAQERPFTLERVTIGGGIRYGTENLNFGLGARGGYTLYQSIYIGGMFDYWFGESKEVGAFGVTSEAHVHAWNLLGVGGYDFGITPTIVIRPYGGFGILHAFGSVCTNAPFVNGNTCLDQSDDNAAGVLGGEALFQFNGFHIGGDMHLLIADDTAFVLAGNFGTDF